MNSQFFTILAIDDSQLNLVLLKAILFKAFPDATFLSALCGKEGIALCRADKPDLVLLDIVMPGMDGYEVCSTIKNDEQLRHISVVMLTANSVSGTSRIKAMESGADGFLTQPLDTAELTVQIKTMIRLRASEIRKINENMRLEKLVQERTEILEKELRERRKAEEAMHISEDKFRNVFEHSTEGKSLITMDGKMTPNNAFCQIVGYTNDELSNLKWQEITHADDIENNQKIIDALISGEQKIARWEKRYIHKNGNIVWVDINTVLQREDEGKPLYFITAISDITRNKRSEEALVKSEQIFRLMSDNVSDVIWSMDNDLKYTFISPSILQLRGLTQEEALQEAFEDSMTASSLQLVYECIVSNQEEERMGVRPKPFVLEIQQKHKNGSLVWVEITVHAIFDASGIRIGVIGVSRDITKRKSSEAELAASEKKYRNLHESMMDGYVYVDMQGLVKDYNASFKLMLGYSDEELHLLTYKDLTPEKWRESESEFVHEQALTRGFSDIFEKEYARKDGAIFPVEIRVFLTKNEAGENEGMWAIVRDITERKKAEEALIESRQQLLDIIDFLPDATFVVDNDKKVIAWNKAMERMTGANKQEMIGKGNNAYAILFYGKKRKQLLDLIDIDDEKLRTRYENIHRAGLSLNAETFAPALYDGTGAYLSVTGAPLFNGRGERIGSVESIRDITDRKQAEKALQESEEKYRNMINLFPDAVIIHAEGRILYANAVSCRFIGAGSFEQAESRKVFDFVHPDFRELFIERINKILTTKDKLGFVEAKFISLENEVVDVEVIGIPVTFMGKPAVQTIARDITARKKAEREVALKDELLHLTGGMAKIGGWEFDADSWKGTWTKEVAHIHDLEPGEGFDAQYVVSFYYGESRRKLDDAIRDAIGNTKPYDLELEMTSAKGIQKWVRTMGVPVVECGKVVKLRGIFQDITDRKASEIIIENERLRLRTLIETIPDLLWLKDPDGTYILCNPVFEQYIGASEQDLTGKTDCDFESKAKTASSRQKDKEVIASGDSIFYEEWATRHTDGQLRLLEITKTPMYGAGRKLIGILGVAKDITEVHQSQKSLLEREEIYSTIVNQAIDAIVLIDYDSWEFVEFNDAACLSLGYTRSEFEKLKVHDIDASIRLRGKKFLNKFKESDATVFETKHRSKDGQVRDVRVSARFLTIRGKEYLSSIWSDITEKNRKEAQLREKDLIFQSLLDNSPVYIFFKDHNFKTLHVSKNFENFLGRSMKDILGKDMYELYPPEEAARMIADDKRIMSEGKLIVVEQEMNGRYFTTIKFPIQLEDAPPMLAGFTIDITERKLAEEAMRDSETRMHTLVQTIPDLIWLKDRDGVFLSCNTMFERAIGAPEIDIIGKTDYDFVDRELADSYRKYDHMAMEAGKSTSNEEWITFADDGHRALLNTIKTPMYDSRGSLIGVLGVGHDITERNLAAEERKLSETRLADAQALAKIGSWETDLLNLKLIWSAETYRIFEISPDNFPATHSGFMAFVHPEDRAKVEAAFAGSLDKHSLNEIEHRIVTPGGIVKFIEERWRIILDAQGRPVRATGTCQNITERKQAEEAIHETESLYRNLVLRMPDGVYKSTHAGRFVDVNPAMVKMLGYANQEELMAVDIKKDLYFEEAERDSIMLQELREEIGIFRMKRKDGCEVWVEDHGWYTPDDQGNILFHEGIMRDVTERKRAEEAIRESEALYRNLVFRLPDGVYKSTHEGKFIDVNPAMVEMLGYEDKEDLMAIDIKSQLYFEPTDRESLLLQEKLEEMGIYPLRKKDGSEIWIEDHGWYICDEQGDILFHEGIMRDVTERRRAEEAIRESEALYRNLVLRLPDGVYKSTHEGKFVDVNPAMVEMLGYGSKEELMDIDIKTQLYFQTVDRESLKLDEGYVEMGIFRLKKKDGSEIWIEDHGWYNRDEEGNILFHEGIMRDVTERKRTQDEIILLNAELEQRVSQRTLQLENTNKELEAFSYSVSHDLRAPLRGIDGWSLALLEDYNHVLDDQGRVYLERVRRESQRMGTLIDDLLKLSRVGRYEMKKVEVDISAIAQTIVDRMREAHQGASCEFCLQPGLIALGDPQMLEIALTNMLDNACKFTGKNALAKIEFGLTNKDGIPTYYVRDNGVGFDMAYANKLFGAFQRMHKQTEFPGTGIGLATVQRIIFRHGGRIWAESKPGEGSTFYFTLS